jgi:hypothetical protein
LVVLAPSEIRRELYTATDVIGAELAILIQHLASVPVSAVADVYCKMELLTVIVCVPTVLPRFIRGWTADDVDACMTEQPKREIRPVPVVVIMVAADIKAGLLVICVLMKFREQLEQITATESLM